VLAGDCLSCINRIDSFSNSNKTTIYRVKKITREDVTLFEKMLEMKILLGRIFSKFDVEVVLYFVGIKYVGEPDLQKPLSYYDCIVEGT